VSARKASTDEVSNRKERAMTTINYTVAMATDLDETNPTAKALLALSDEARQALLESAFKAMVAEAIEKANEGNSWATLRVA
jgi:hypothetical protein